MRRSGFSIRGRCAVYIAIGVVLYVNQPIIGMAQQTATTQSSTFSIDKLLDLKVIPLWDQAAPGSMDDSGSDTPTLTAFTPQPRTENGTAVIVAPGGAYLGLANNLEGRQVADWFAAHGVTAFLLTYRLGPKYSFPVPMWDAQRAIRTVRYHAHDYNISPSKIGMIGFSAGGHLAAISAVLADDGNADAPDPIDRMSSHLDFLILAYPWLNAMKTGQHGVLSYCGVMPKIPLETCQQFEREYTPLLHVTSKAPPTFIYHTSADQTVPVEASIAFYRALQVAGVPVEMHVFAHGAHGTGLGLGNPALDLWPVLLAAWLRDQGLLTSSPPS